MHYRFGYCGIQNRSPANLTKDEAHELRLMVEGKKSKNESIREKLIKYGYAYKKEDKFIPNVGVIKQSTCQAFLKFCKKEKFRFYLSK